MDITGNTIFIPGATSGIGLGLALRLQAAGNTVIIGGRRVALLDQLTAAHPGLHAVEIDTADPASILAARDRVLAAHPQLNVLITMAGIMLPEDLHTPGFLEVAERTVTTNLLGPIRLVAAFVEHLSAQPAATLMTVSSGLAFVPLTLTPTYSATKAGIHSFTEALRFQLADTSVQVLELAPPAVQTPLMGQDESGRGMPLDDFLTEVMQLIESQPDAREILVKNVEPLRFATERGTYAQVFDMLSGSH